MQPRHRSIYLQATHCIPVLAIVNIVSQSFVKLSDSPRVGLTYTNTQSYTATYTNLKNAKITDVVYSMRPEICIKTD